MKKIIALVLCAVMALTSVGAFAYDDEVTEVKIDLADKSPFGEFEGWGTSICWWGHDMGKKLDDGEKDTVVKALYDCDEGLGLNIARFNIGGGDDPEHDHQRRDDGRNMPGFLDKDGNWDFTADQGQIDFLVKIRDAGADILEAFSNSPPYFMTESGCSSGGKNPNDDNLPKENYDEFANYLAEVILYLKNTYGIDFDTVDPMNEPDTDYWSYGGWQEGCHFDAASHSGMILAMRRALDEKGLQSVGVAAADENNISKMTDNLTNVYTQEAIDTLARVNVHSYQVGSYEGLKEITKKLGKKLYMTEVDGDGSAGEDAKSMGPALWFSQKITDDLRGLEANAWVMWQAIGMAYPNSHRDSGYWNICQYDPETKSVDKFKKYYAFMHYTKFIRQGDTLVKANLSNVLSAVNEEEGKAVFVITNSTGKDRIYNINTDNIGLNVKSVKAFVTDNDRDFAPIEASNTITLGANSIATVVFEGEFSGGSINLAEKDGAICAKAGETLEFEVTDEKGGTVSAKLSLSENAPAEIAGSTVTVKGEGEFEVYAEYGAMRDSYRVYSFTDSSKVRIIGRGSKRALNGRGEDIFLTETSLLGSQMWQMEKDGEYYLFKNDRTGKYLSAEDSLTTGERNEYALWRLEKDEGYYSLINPKSEKSLDVYNHATHEGARVGLYDYNGGYNQLWYFDAREPKTAMETEYTVSPKVLKGESFGSDAWIGNAEVTYDKAWDGDANTFFDAETGSDGYTATDLGEKHTGFNKIRISPRLGFDYRVVGAKIMGGDEKDGEYDLIYEIKEEDVRSEKVNIKLPEMKNYRYVKYVSPEEGYCNVAEIELIYEPYEPVLTFDEGGLEIDLGEYAPGGEKYVVARYENYALTKVDIFTDGKDAANLIAQTENDISLTVLGGDNSIIYVMFVKKY